jgi:hypothetical protein
VDAPFGANLVNTAHANYQRNGRRHQVDFGDSPIRVEIHSSDETVEIFIEADYEALPKESRRFAIMNVPRHEFSRAAGLAARRARRSGDELYFLLSPRALRSDPWIIEYASGRRRTDCETT